MLEKYIFFVSKQPSLIEISDIHQCVFSRVGASMGATAARTFDLKIVTKSGPEYTFTSINKEEHEPVEAYLKDKKVKLKNEMVPDVDMLAAVGDSSDEEMQSVASSGDEMPKPRLGGDDEDSEEGAEFSLSYVMALILVLQMKTSRPRLQTRVLRVKATQILMAVLLPLMLAEIASWRMLRKERKNQPRRRRRARQVAVMQVITKTNQRRRPRPRQPVVMQGMMKINPRRRPRPRQLRLVVMQTMMEINSRNQRPNLGPSPKPRNGTTMPWMSTRTRNQSPSLNRSRNRNLKLLGQRRVKRTNPSRRNPRYLRIETPMYFYLLLITLLLANHDFNICFEIRLQEYVVTPCNIQYAMTRTVDAGYIQYT
jgi:hypothetical protein